ncbi:uncharacterized protein LOC106164540 [Lingula anatina]|uniref:Uncharacterized protein LOC106164540 n=1 Tax=Lingula anatina TaxID=7574 RepID=A0A1S3IK93_LINAN|nr:uncharacterized protein LOC106164540 [Lingula anatina]|eukprot:XP_013397939.1 uncharacterized protein LOC106164540 [Lingula anatina]
MSQGQPFPLTEESIFAHFSQEDRELLLSDTLTGRWWYEGFTLLLRCFREDKNLTSAGRQRVEARLVDVLKNRLAISRRLRSVDLSKFSIKRPIFIIGPCRTGTSFLQELLFQDPQNTSLMYYEVLHPVVDVATVGTDPRILEEEQAQASMNETVPQMKSIHKMEAGSPYEGHHLFENIGVFKAPAFQGGNSGEYVTWYEARTNEEMAEAYRFHKLQTQLILNGRAAASSSRRMVFKENYHSLYLDAILKVYPDAIFVHTYRNPCTSLASLCSLRETYKLLAYEQCDIDLEQLGREVLNWAFLHGGTEMMKFRKNHPDLEHRFVDIAFDDLVTSPLNAVKKIYDHFGLELTDQGKDNMEAYVKENPQNKHGRHKYDLKRYHLTEEEVLGHFKEYVEEYKIPC